MQTATLNLRGCIHVTFGLKHNLLKRNTLNLAEDLSALVRNFLALPQTRQFKREQTHPRRLSA